MQFSDIAEQRILHFAGNGLEGSLGANKSPSEQPKMEVKAEAGLTNTKRREERAHQKLERQREESNEREEEQIEETMDKKLQTLDVPTGAEGKEADRQTVLNLWVESIARELNIPGKLTAAPPSASLRTSSEGLDLHYNGKKLITLHALEPQDGIKLKGSEAENSKYTYERLMNDLRSLQEFGDLPSNLK